MSKPIFIADVHLNIYNKFAKPIEGSPINDRTQVMFDTLEKAFDIGIKRKSPVVIAGDLFDERKQVNTLIMNRTLELIKRKVQEIPRGVPLLVLQGNHDAYSNEPDTESSIDILPLLSTEEHPIIIFKEHVQQYTYDGIVYTFLPYTEDTDTLKSEIKALVSHPKQEGYKYLLVAHLGVEGADSGHYNHRLSGAFGVGDLYPEYFDYGFFGHFHYRSHVAPNMVYVGSLVPLNFNDVDQTKGIYLYDSESGKATYRAIDNKQFKVVDLTKETYTDEEFKKILADNYVRVITNNRDLVKDLNQNDEIKDYINLEYKAEEKIESRLGVDPTASTKEIVKSYTEKYHPGVTEQALSILSEVLQ